MGDETAECDSCLNYENCKKKEKNLGVCKAYHTHLIQMYDGKMVQFHCPTNNTFSDWFKRGEYEKPEVQNQTAQKLRVRGKDVWKLLISDNLPRDHEPLDFPEFDLTDIDNDQKRHIRFQVARWLMQNHTFLTVSDTDEIHIYQNGIYVPKGEEIIIPAIRRALGEHCTTYDRNEVRAMIRDATLTDRKVFNHNEPKICVENGILNLHTLEFQEHTPEEFFLQIIPVKYDPEATCPQIDKFLKEIVASSDVQTLYEMNGYCIYPYHPIHKGFMLIGGGSNGKSTYLNLTKFLLGKENVSSISLQQLGQSRFATSALTEKFANIYPDIPSQALKNTGTFKMLTGQDLIGAEFKFGKYFTFENHAKLLFSANQIPETTDDTEAFFRRWMIIVFPNRFTDFTEPKSDKNILEKLTTPQELSGLLNKAVKALSNLLDKGKFHGDKPTAEWREDYIRKSDPIAAFYMDGLEEVNDIKLYVTKTALYQAFIRYCKTNKLPTVDNSVFSKKIKAHFDLAKEAKKRIGIEKKRVKVWTHLKLKSGEQKTLPEN